MKSKIKKINTKLGQKVLFVWLILIILVSPLIFVWKIPLKDKIEVFNDPRNKIRVDSSATLINNIYIDDTHPSYNWETFASLHTGDSWFTNATGTVGDPYVIDNVLISGFVSNIVIQNSKTHFMIINSAITSSQYDGQGIIMINVSHGRIINNNFTNNNRGLQLIDSHENLIERNFITNNDYEGITLENSHDNIILNNTLDNNKYSGIDLFESENNTIKNNIIKNHGHLDEYDRVVDGAGISLWMRSFYNNLSGNTFTDNLYCGIEFNSDSANTTVIENNFSNNGMCAIILDDTNNNTLRDNIMNNGGILFDGIWANMESNEINSTNLINNKPIYFYNNKSDISSIFFFNAGQVILTNCSNSVISSLVLSPGSVGFTLIHCRNITLYDIKASNNSLYGIYLIDCINVTILESITNSNGDCGIRFEGCNNSRILDSEASYNDELISFWLNANDFSFKIGCGISLISGINNLIAENNIRSNNISGVSLESYSNYNNISNNVFTNNNLLIEGRYNTIFNNTFANRLSQIVLSKGENLISENVFNGVYDAIELWGEGHTLITKNIFNGVRDAIELHSSSGNDIIDNIIDGDGGYGIEFYSSSSNRIEGNKITGVVRCFTEDQFSTSNVFIDNICEDEQSQFIINIIIIVIIGVSLAGVVLVIVFIKKRKGRKSQE